MTGEKPYTLGDDLPKSNPWTDDRLGYANFAKRIATVLIKMKAPNGYVIGIHGRWGSGKSTALNFILEHIKKHNAEHEDDQIIHIDFRPWIVSGHQDLIAAFFKILSERLGPRGTRWTRFRNRGASWLNGTTDNLVDAAATVALTVDPSGGTASRFAGTLTKKSVEALLDKYLENPSLQAAYEDLKAQLGRSSKRFVITIDDIDRLEDKDVRSIMQMVKSTGQLPNVVYLLAYDRDIVYESLDQGKNRIGPRFAEKIVQQEIELPSPSSGALLAILDEEIEFITGPTENGARWQYLVRDGVRRWIRSPRDVVRLANALKFSWPALEGEIDPQDLLAIEGVRLFDQSAFYWVRDNRDFLFTEGRFVLAEDGVREAAVANLKRRIPEEIQPQVIRILSVLFPQATKWFEGREAFGEEAHIEVTRRRGIGSEAGYDAYFGLHPSSDAIPKAVVDDLMSKLDDVDAVEAIIRSYLGKKNSRGELMIAKLLDELRVQYRGRRPAPPTQGLLNALFRVGEEVIGLEDDRAMFVLSPRTQIGFLIRNLLEQWGVDEAGSHLVEAFQTATSPAFVADVYVDRGRELGAFRSASTEQPVITDADFEKLGPIMLEKIEKAASEGSLQNAPFYFDIIRAWAHLAGIDKPKAWLSNGIKKSAGFMIKAASGLVSYSIGENTRRYTMREPPDPSFYDLSMLVEEGNNHLKNSELTDDERNLLRTVVRGSERLLAGQTPDRFFYEDE